MFKRDAGRERQGKAKKNVCLKQKVIIQYLSEKVVQDAGR